jgi:hypothetical protein
MTHGLFDKIRQQISFARPVQINIVLNWLEELKQRVPIH